MCLTLDFKLHQELQQSLIYSDSFCFTSSNFENAANCLTFISEMSTYLISPDCQIAVLKLSIDVELADM